MAVIHYNTLTKAHHHYHHQKLSSSSSSLSLLHNQISWKKLSILMTITLIINQLSLQLLLLFSVVDAIPISLKTSTINEQKIWTPAVRELNNRLFYNYNDDDLDVGFDGLNNYKEAAILPVINMNQKSFHKTNEESTEWNNDDPINNNRKKRSGIADQRLAELLVLARLDMVRKLMRDNTHQSMGEGVAYGLIDPHLIGRRKRRQVFDDNEKERRQHKNWPIKNLILRNHHHHR